VSQAELDRIDVMWDALRSFGMIDGLTAVHLTPVIC